MTGSLLPPRFRSQPFEHHAARRWAWLVAPLMLAAVFGGITAIFHAPAALTGWVIGVLVGAAFLWMGAALFFLRARTARARAAASPAWSVSTRRPPVVYAVAAAVTRIRWRARS